MRATRPDLALSQVFPSFLFFPWTHYFCFVCSSQIHFSNYSGQSFIIVLFLSFPFVSHPASTFARLPAGQIPDHPNALRDLVAKHEGSIPLTLQSLPDPVKLSCEHFPRTPHILS